MKEVVNVLMPHIIRTFDGIDILRSAFLSASRAVSVGFRLQQTRKDILERIMGQFSGAHPIAEVPVQVVKKILECVVPQER